MQRENIYLLGSSRQLDDNSIIFQVVGSASNLYDVIVDFNPNQAELPLTFEF